MGFREVLDGIKPEFDVIVARAQIPPVPWDYGARKISGPGAPPRVIWVPWHTKFGPLSRAASPTISNPRPLWSTHTIVAAHTWGADESACEQLNQAVLQALAVKLPNGHRPVLVDWTVGETSSNLLNGVLAVMHVELDIPVVRELDGTVVITGFTITPKVLHPGDPTEE